MIFNRTASAFCLTMAFTGIFSSQITLAESVDIQFRGVVESRASFGISTPGKMESIFSDKAGKGKNQFTSITPAKINSPDRLHQSYPWCKNLSFSPFD